mmetsp:Transcript_18133/g.50980  ORF Transcript_18133/g.50980 Transcript_18133/m.50980 type:complete len:219 (+) Transcript_18133:207-863(+)
MAPPASGLPPPLSEPLPLRSMPHSLKPQSTPGAPPPLPVMLPPPLEPPPSLLAKLLSPLCQPPSPPPGSLPLLLGPPEPQSQPPPLACHPPPPPSEDPLRPSPEAVASGHRAAAVAVVRVSDPLPWPPGRTDRPVGTASAQCAATAPRDATAAARAASVQSAAIAVGPRTPSPASLPSQAALRCPDRPDIQPEPRRPSPPPPPLLAPSSTEPGLPLSM